MTLKLKDVPDDIIREEYVKRYTLKSGAKLNSSKSVANHLRGYFSGSKTCESFVMIYLNSQHELIDTKILFTGTIATAAIYPREIIKSLLIDYPGTAAVIISHNHPSGSNTPSSPDFAITKKIKTALESIDIELLDHIILGSNYYSFSDHHQL
jgi:DNA repair protein RadC